MPLTWDISEVDNYKDVCWIEAENDKVRLNPLTEVLVFATMSIGMSKITQQNWPEFYARIKFNEKFLGPFLVKDHKDRYLKPEDIKSHIGLKTNVTQETRSQFLKRFNTDLDSYKRQATTVE